MNRVKCFESNSFDCLGRRIDAFLVAACAKLISLLPLTTSTSKVHRAIIIYQNKPQKAPMKKSMKENKVKKVMKEFGEEKLHSGSKKGPIVKDKKQALAIGYSEAKKKGKK